MPTTIPQTCARPHIRNLDDIIADALHEDAADHDLTCLATIPSGQAGEAVISAKAAGTLSGIAVAQNVFTAMDADIRQQWLLTDSEQVACGDMLCRLTGPLHALLAAERTALNFLQHLSGIATATRAFVEAVEGTGCGIVDTRKTTPGLRLLEKQAVVHGGGMNHRMDLASGMLIKENHIETAGSISAAVAACRKMQSDAWIEVECETLNEVREAIAAGPDIILLDNMDTETIRQARRLVPPAIVLEASGNITLESARAFAETGVDRLAVGCITHSAMALDLSMRVKRS